MAVKTCLAQQGTPVTPPGEATPAATASPEAAVPAFYFSPLKLTGVPTADGGAVRLQADVEVHITRDAGWYDVPLRFPQAIVEGFAYDGPQEPVPVEAPEGAADDGLHWLFHGVGAHRLTLQLLVPVRRGPNGTELLLTLPAVPRQFPTQLELTIASGNVSAIPGKDNLVRTSHVTDASTTLRVTIVGSRLDLAWSSASERPGSIPRVTSVITLDRNGEFLRLQARQTLSTEGRVATVRLRPPRGFSFVAVTGSGYLGHTLPTAPDDLISVAVVGGERGEVELDWEFAAPFPAGGGTVVVDGFSVEGALRQGGTIGIGEIRGYSVVRSGSGPREIVNRADASSARGALPFLRTAYRFDAQPFELSLAVRAQQPSISARPRAIISLSEDQVELTLDYQVRVDAGRIDSVELNWPPGARDGWKLQSADPGLGLGSETETAADFVSERQLVEFQESRDGTSSVRMTYARSLTGDQFEVRLPTISADRVLPAWVLIRGSPSVVPELDAAAPRAALKDPLADEWLASESFDASRDAAYSALVGDAVFSGRITVHELSIGGTTDVQLDRLDEPALLVRQRLDLDVQFGRIQELLLEWPETFPETPAEATASAIECQDASGLALPLQRAAGLLKVQFPAPQIGRVTLQLTYTLPRPANGLLSVPVFALPGGGLRATTLTTQRTATVAVRPTEPLWSPLPTALDLTWIASTPVTQIPVQLSSALADVPQAFAVERALARIWFDDGGHTRVVAGFQLASAPQHWVLSLDSLSEEPVFAWNGERLVADSEQQPDGSVQYRLDRGADSASAGWLTCAYRGPEWPRLNPFQETQVGVPRFPEGVSLPAATIELVTPDNWCLLSYPPGLSPLFAWQSGLIFERRNDAKYLAERESLWTPLLVGQQSSVGSVDLRDDGNVYAFASGGKVEGVSARLVSLWMMILIGSGMTLALSFVLWSIPATRSVLTLVAAGFLLSLGGVFASEAVELLLQPVLLGIVGAVIAIGMQIRRHRPDQRAFDPVVSVPRLGSGALPDGGVAHGNEATRSQAPLFEAHAGGLPR